MALLLESLSHATRSGTDRQRRADAGVRDPLGHDRLPGRDATGGLSRVAGRSRPGTGHQARYEERFLATGAAPSFLLSLPTPFGRAVDPKTLFIA